MFTKKFCQYFASKQKSLTPQNKRTRNHYMQEKLRQYVHLVMMEVKHDFQLFRLFNVHNIFVSVCKAEKVL